jgi:putative MATE family efflux protein
VDTTAGPLVTKVLLLSWPIVLTHLLQITESVADVWMVGKLGAQELAAVGIARSVMAVLIPLSLAVSMGVQILVAQYCGRREMEKADRVVKQGIIAATMMSLLIVTPLGLLISGWLMKALGATPEVVEHGVPYLQLLFAGVVFMVLSFVITAALQGAGDTVTPLLLLVMTNVLNITINYVCIFGVGPVPAMGVTGAAVGTLTSRMLATIAGLLILSSGRFALTVNWFGRWYVRWHLWPRIFGLGVPMSVQGITRELGSMVLIKVLSLTAAGMYGVSAFTVVRQVRMVTRMMGLALMAGATTAVGQNYGARNLRRVVHANWLSAGIAAGISTVAGLLYTVFSAEIVTSFSSHAEVIRIGSQALIILVISEPFMTAGLSISGSLRGTGDTISPLWINIATITLLGPLFSYLLAIPAGMGTVGVWIGYDIGVIARFFVLTWQWQRGKWRESVGEEPS